MGMTAGTGKPAGVHRDINVTPLIDVLLVLLIIFLVVMPLMIKRETLEVPRKLEGPEVSDQIPLVVTIHKDLTAELDDSTTKIQLLGADLAKTLRPRLVAMPSGSDKVVFVDFEPEVPWAQVIATMDSIRSLADDVDHDAIKVALKLREGP